MSCILIDPEGGILSAIFAGVADEAVSAFGVEQDEIMERVMQKKISLIIL